MSDVMMKALQLQVESLTRQVGVLGPENARVRQLLTDFAARHEEDERKISALSDALRRWEQSGCPDCGGDCSSANPPIACCIMRETRAALTGEGGE